MKKILAVIILLVFLFLNISLFSANQDSKLTDREIIQQMKSEFIKLIKIYTEHINILQRILANKIATLRETKEGTEKHSRLKKVIETTQSEIDLAKKQLAEFKDIVTNPEREKDINLDNYNRLKSIIASIKYSEFVYFDSGGISISDSGKKTLNDFKTYIEDKKDFVIVVQGHADTTPLGAELKTNYKDNEGLSLARAREVRNYLVNQLNLNTDIILLEGKSSFDPISIDKAKNRRVELILKPRYF